MSMVQIGWRRVCVTSARFAFSLAAGAAALWGPAGGGLTAVKTSDVAGGAATFEKVLRKVRTGEMPPLGLPAPDAATRSAFVSWLESELDHASTAKPNPGAPSIHRLNRAEYSNAIRDLLALDLDHSAGLPQDDSGYGFDNIGD